MLIVGCDIGSETHYIRAIDTLSLIHIYVKEGDTILVKASHFMEFPKVVEALSK